MATVYKQNLLTKVREFQDPDNFQKFDRIIADIPSFVNRWPASIGTGMIRDCTSAVADLAKNNLTEDGTVTVSCTGIAQERWDEWMEAEGNQYFELVPGSTWAMFRPTAYKISTNKHFWHRRDDYTFVRTYRKIGSSFTIKRDAWPNIDGYPRRFGHFPFPDSMNDVELSAFRAPVHRGVNEAQELQKWLIKNGIEYSVTTRDDGIQFVRSINSDDASFLGGYVIQFSSDPADWIHLPKEILNHQGPNGPYFNSAVMDRFEGGTNFPGLNELFKPANHRHVMLSSWIVQTHSNEGDLILDPFCSWGSTVAAALVNKRDIIGVEANPGRADNAARVIQDLS